MPQKVKYAFIALCAFASSAFAINAEVFAKASASRTYSQSDTFSLNLSGAGGLAILIIPQIRLEGRYTVHKHSQNQLLYQGYVFKDLITQNNIYSLGLDIDILSDKHTVQPFILVGAGYLQSWSQYTSEETGETFVQKREGISANAGAGFRVRIARSLALEIEAFAYATDPHKPNPLIDFYANAGIRIFL